MKRWLVRILLCFFLGAVTTLGVAWGVAFLPFRYHALFHRSDEGAAGAALSRFGGMQVWIKQVYSQRFAPYRGGEDLQIRVASLELLLAYLEAANSPVWPPADKTGRIDADENAIDAALARVTVPRRVRDFVCIDQTGWPLRAMESQFATDVTWTLTEGSRTPIRIDATWRKPGCRLIPTRLIPSGFLLDTTFHAAVWLGLLFGFTTARRIVRMKRGRCLKCGYNLRGAFEDGCSECGWGRGDG